MLGTEYLMRALVADGVDHIFMVPGGLVDKFYPELQTVGAPVPIVAAHEGGAAFMADGYARAGDQPGAYLCIGGPGLGNSVTALAAAFTDESPVLALSGEVATVMEGLGKFQDASTIALDDTHIVAPVTKFSCSVTDARLLRHRYRHALKVMLSGVPGPAHLSLPQEVLDGELEVDVGPTLTDVTGQQPMDCDSASRLWRLIESRNGGTACSKIAILAGRGLWLDDASDRLLQVAEEFSIPVATTAAAKGLFPEDHPLSLGNFGYAGTRHSAAALLDEELDLLLVLGSGMSERDSLFWTSRLQPRCGLVSVNVSNIHIGCFNQREHFVEGHAGSFLRWMLTAGENEKRLLEEHSAERREWVETVRSSSPRYYDEENLSSDQVPIHPARVVSGCRRVFPRETIALCDSGSHRAFVTHYWDSFLPRTFLSATNIGPMGWAIPAGIGAALASPGRPVAVFTGDGCMQMHGMEVQTAARYRVPVVFVVINNRALGNVWLRAHKVGPLADELTTVVDHDWAAFARSLGASAMTVQEPDRLEEAITDAVESRETFLLDVKCERDCPTPIEPFSQAKAEWTYHE